MHQRLRDHTGDKCGGMRNLPLAFLLVIYCALFFSLIIYWKSLKKDVCRKTFAHCQLNPDRVAALCHASTMTAMPNNANRSFMAVAMATPTIL